MATQEPASAAEHDHHYATSDVDSSSVGSSFLGDNGQPFPILGGLGRYIEDNTARDSRPARCGLGPLGNEQPRMVRLGIYHNNYVAGPLIANSVIGRLMFRPKAAVGAALSKEAIGRTLTNGKPMGPRNARMDVGFPTLSPHLSPTSRGTDTRPRIYMHSNFAKTNPWGTQGVDASGQVQQPLDLPEPSRVTVRTPKSILDSGNSRAHTSPMDIASPGRCLSVTSEDAAHAPLAARNGSVSIEAKKDDDPNEEHAQSGAQT